MIDVYTLVKLGVICLVGKPRLCLCGLPACEDSGNKSIKSLAFLRLQPDLASHSMDVHLAPSRVFSALDAFRWLEEEQDLAELNKSLDTLAVVFPYVLPEVFREMLSMFSGDSRLHVVMDQLLKHREKWVRGRWRAVNAMDVTDTFIREGPAPLPLEHRFRRGSYRKAARALLFQEFRTLSKSTLGAVMAEHNYSYTLSRPALQQIAAKSWRNSISTFLSKLKRPSPDLPQKHPMLLWSKPSAGAEVGIPVLKMTGDGELDQELHHTILKPILDRSKKEQEAKDWQLALEVNEQEAVNAEALHECQCCFSDRAFEEMAACTANGHMICFHCVRQAVNEALFGQSWGRNIDHKRGQIVCLAPTAEHSCVGCVPRGVVRRAVLQTKGGAKTWLTLESRLAEEALTQASLLLIRCPFCSYAELDDVYFPPDTVQYSLNSASPISVILLLMTANFLPFLVLYILLHRFCLFKNLPALSTLISNSLCRSARHKHLTRRFQCRAPDCGVSSCLECAKSWLDPHVCYESATASLRTTIEAARTAALKRTCPRCGLGFIKESGCNKMTCVCGYMMCYVCRQGLGRDEGGEGYSHFCQHFRPGGGKCTDCNKCDLYKDEEEEGLVRMAGENAENEWREREGMVGVKGIGGGQDESAKDRWWERESMVQDFVDWWVEKLIVC